MRVFLAALLFLVLASGADAQRRGHAIARQGDLAVTATFNGFDSFTISPLEGGVGLRYWAGDRTVLATSVSLGGQDESTENSDTTPIGDGEIFSSSTQTQEAQSASLALWVEQHVGRRRSTVSPFVGASLLLGSQNTERTGRNVTECDNVPGCENRAYTAVQDTEVLTVGGGLILGAEVKIVGGVTLSGAYTLGATYRDRETREFIEQRRDGQTLFEDDDLVTTDGWQFGVGTTRVALSVYF